MCKYNIEVQAVHFGANRNQITLHTEMFYTSEFKQGFTTLSPSLQHDAPAIIAHLKVTLDHYLSKFPNVQISHFFSVSLQVRNTEKNLCFI